MAENQIRKLTSEPAVFLLIFTSLLLFRLTFNKELANDIITIFGFMLIGDFILFQLGQNDIRSVSGNTGQSIINATIALGVLFGLYQVVNFTLRQSVLPLDATSTQLQQTVFQTVYQSLVQFSGQVVDLSVLKPIKYYLFGFIIPLVETRVLGRIYGTVGNLTNINIGNSKSAKTWALRVLIALLFMWFHLQVRGVNNNIDLVMTFLFGLITSYLVGKFRELESANWLHVMWNTLALALGK